MMKKVLFAAVAAVLAMQLPAYEYFLESGAYRVRINEKYKHTIREVVWQGKVLATQTGYYGAILCPASGKYIGAGHTEGGAEKVLSVKVICDGKEVAFDLNNNIFSFETVEGKKYIIAKSADVCKLPKTNVEINRDMVMTREIILFIFHHSFPFVSDMDILTLERNFMLLKYINSSGKHLK